MFDIDTLQNNYDSHSVFVLNMKTNQEENADPYYLPLQIGELPTQITCTRLDAPLMRDPSEMSNAEETLITNCLGKCDNPFIKYCYKFIFKPKV